MSVKYRVARVPDKDGAKPDWSEPVDVIPARDMNVRRQRRHQGAGYVMREQDTVKWSPKRTLDEVHDRLPPQLDGLRIGEIWVVRALEDEFRTWTRKVEVEPPAIDTPGTDAIDHIYGWLQDGFRGQWENWGICVCKHISGSSSWSQHAYCNAIDVHASTTVMDQIAKAAVAAANRGDIPCDQVIWKGWEHIHGGSVYDHLDHVHLTGLPQRSGWPTAC